MYVHGKITAKNQTTVPIAVRKALGVGPGDRLRYAVGADGSVRLEKDASSLMDLSGLVTLDRPVSDAELNAWIAERRGRSGA